MIQAMISHNNITPVDDPAAHFKLDSKFLEEYANKKPNFGFNGLGEFVFYRTYSRLKEDNTKETFLEVVKRVVEGCYEIQRRHCLNMHIPWTRKKAQASAKEMFQRIWDFKFTPPGRGLWIMGTRFMWERGSAALNNCSFISTADIDTDPTYPFCFLMDMSMLGVGVGFDTMGANKVSVIGPSPYATVHVIQDSREGWVDSLRALLLSYFEGNQTVEFDYSLIRPAGSHINGFGGKASGPQILQDMHHYLRIVLDKYIGKKLNSVGIVDIMNIIGAQVVAGNVRRSSEIALGSRDDQEYVEMKDYRKFPDECRQHRWASNNSILATVGMNYDGIAEQIAINGEPGLFWLENTRKYGRLCDGVNNKDFRATGTNPCSEITLESGELCNLVECYPANHTSAEDYARTLKFAYLYAKTVTLLPTHVAKTNAVTMRNRRIGLSMSGVIQAFKKFGRRTFLDTWCRTGYDVVQHWDNTYSNWLCVPRSIKTTSIKPSGTVSLVTGSTPGIHYPFADAYWRRVRISRDSEFVPILKAAGYHIEDSVTDKHTLVVTFGVLVDEGLEFEQDVSIHRQCNNLLDMQDVWSDNQVSVTIKFKPEEASEIKSILEMHDARLKSISFLPIENHGYAQAPYEKADRNTVIEYLKGLKPVDYTGITEDAVGEKYCDSDKCTVPQK